jgi:hypothetical protein
VDPTVSKRGKIIVMHFVGRMPFAGIAWQAIHYIMGLERLGYEVWYVEDGGANPYDPRSSSETMVCDYNIAFLRRVMERCGIDNRWAYWDAINDAYYGLSREQVHSAYAEADGLINLCGATSLRHEHLACPIRIMVDTDPIYEQIKYAKADRATRAYLDAHTHFFTYGENLGTPDCPVPLSGIPWRPTRPPVDPDLWPEPEGEPKCFTTIASWDNKGKDIEFAGSTYIWSKHLNFLRFINLPQRQPRTCFRMAMSPLDAMVYREIESHGWTLVDPRPISADLATYQQFITSSQGEFTVAKDIYVRPNSGWFSDRSVCYLAAGRPVVTMRTGFNKLYPVGRGLFDYANEDEACAALDAVASQYAVHSRAARMLAQEYFSAERVLGRLMAEVGL